MFDIYIFCLADFSKDFANLDPLELMEGLELVDISLDILDDIWKQDDHKEYSQQRMTHLFDIFGGSIGRYIQKKISSIELWKEKFTVVKENLQYGIQICEKWASVCETLTDRFWKTYHSHPWKGDKYGPFNLMKLCDRLQEVLDLILFTADKI